MNKERVYDLANIIERKMLAYNIQWVGIENLADIYKYSIKTAAFQQLMKGIILFNKEHQIVRVNKDWQKAYKQKFETKKDQK